VGEELRITSEIKVLAPFALWLQSQAPGPGGAARRYAVRTQLIDLLARQFKGDREAAEEEADLFLELGQRQTGLLVERGEGWFGFFHPTFKEYLAARACVLEGQMEVVGTWEVLRPHLDDALWHEVILLTVGYKAIVEAQDAAAAYLVRQIAAEPDEPDGHGENVALAGRCLADVGRGLVPDDCWEETVGELVCVMQDTALNGPPNDPPVVPIPTRYAAAETLDRLGWLPEDLNGFVEIPIPKSQIPIYIAQYPVTNAQFARFIAADGYGNADYWDGEKSDAWRWRMIEHNVDWRGEGPVTQPEYWDHSRFGKNRRGYPVVGVSWYEAMAYCAWLSELLERLRAGEELKPAQRDLIAGLPEDAAVVRLPTEGEWTAAAGGEEEEEEEEEEERFPWGPQWHESRANTHEGGIGGTSPVGMYPSGRSPTGVWDMGGNVWEWCSSLYKPYPYDPSDGRENLEAGALRVVRGGSFDGNRYFARCAYRDWYSPLSDWDHGGFRVVVSPISPASAL